MNGLCVSNEYGSIEWLEPVDITYEDLENNILIEKDQIKLYPLGNVPERGHKLYKKMRVTHIQPTTETAAKKEQQLRKFCNQNKLRFVSYNKETSKFVFITDYL